MAWIRAMGASSNKFTIYDNGVMVSLDNPGNYKTNNSSVDSRLINATISSSVITFSPTSGKWYAVGINSAIDLTSYTKLHIVGTATGTSDITYCVGNSKNIIGSDIIASGTFLYNTDLTPTEYILDISSITGSKFIYFYTHMSGGAGGTVTKIWLD